MKQQVKEQEFERSVKNKFYVYNSLFLNLPFKQISNTGMLIPLMYHEFRSGLEAGKDPLQILDTFMRAHTDLEQEDDKIEFMFRVIRYVERQVVLYDSVEDASFTQISNDDNFLSVRDFVHLAESGNYINDLARKLSGFSARIVFTAHPTQFYPPSVLDIIARLRTLITANNIDGIDLSLQQLGLTSFINAKKPTPFDEAGNIIYYLRNVYYDAVGELYTGLKKALAKQNFDNPEILKLGFWPGGDRDGNPYVTSDITKRVADELRMTLMNCYYADTGNLAQKLTFREVDEQIRDLRNLLYSAMFDAGKTLSADELIRPLMNVREMLVTRYNSLYLNELEALIDKVRIFRTHFASLDIRQNHDVHERTVEQLFRHSGLISNSLDELDENELTDLLLHKNLPAEASWFEDMLVKDTISTIKQLKLIQKKNGEEGCNRYIISNSENVFSVLYVFALFRWCGYRDGEMNADIIPLFESMDGMANAPHIMQSLFEIPEYRAHLRHRNDKQTMMLGFSDGTKDGGYLKANWEIFRTKENLTAVCNQHNIKAIFFDGRGGPPARGGGKTHRFYAAQGPGIANHEIQLTIQGQTITSKYGTKEQFIHNSEQLLTAGLSNRFSENENSISESSRQLIDRLASLSFERYNALKNHPMFIPYLENKSTLRYYGMANIGSRPVKRSGNAGLTLKDLRAIPFVGSWSQLRQNVPGYFGIGTAIDTLVREGKTDELKSLFRDVPFFKALILNSMMSLFKSNFRLTSYIAGDPAYTEFWNILHDEYQRSKAMTLLISGLSELMEEEPVSRNSVKIREEIVLPLLIIQQYALQKIESGSEYSPAYEKIVQRSLYGNINASRNSA